MSKLRLVKVHVQPFYVLDDGENLTAVENAPVAVVTPEDWPAFPTKQFAEAQTQLEVALTKPEPKPNRAARRSAARKKSPPKAR